MTTTRLRRPIDLHPDDPTNRAQLLAALKTARLAAGYGIRTLGPKLGIHLSAVAMFENDPRANPKIGAAQRYARAVHHRVILTIHDLPDPDPDDPLVRMLAGMTDHGDLVRADQLHRSRTLAHLVSVRHQTGRIQRDIATRLGVTIGAVKQIEGDRPDPMLSTYQRYTRALGGALTAHLQPAQDAP